MGFRPKYSNERTKEQKQQFIFQCMNTNTLICFKKQRVYQQPVLGWKIDKQLSGLNSLSLNNNKNYKLEAK